MKARTVFPILCGSLLLGAPAPFAGEDLVQSAPSEAAKPESKAKSKGICKAGVDVRDNVVKPPDVPFDGNPPVAAVTLKKPCKGAVLARFTSEIDTRGTNQIISIDAVAVCKSSGGYANGCTKGEVRQSQPEFYDLGFGSLPLASHSADFVWRDLKPGKWRFTIIGAGHENASMMTRKLQVEAYEGG